MRLGLCLLLDVAPRLLVDRASHVYRGDGDEVWGVEETKVGAVSIVDEEPAQRLSERAVVVRTLAVPCHLQSTFVHLQSALACAPVPRAVVNANTHLTGFCLADVAALL